MDVRTTLCHRWDDDDDDLDDNGVAAGTPADDVQAGCWAEQAVGAGRGGVAAMKSTVHGRVGSDK